MKMIAEKTVYDVPELAETLSISTRKARGLIAANTFKILRIGTRVLVPADEVRRYIAENVGAYVPAAVGRGAGR